MYKRHKQYRLYGYDYAQDGCYFITLVTKDRLHHFGEIINDELILNKIGHFAQKNINMFLYDSTLQNPFANNPYFLNQQPHLISINEFVIMPNHIHLIVEIVNKEYKEPVFVKGLQPLVKGSISSFINHFKGKIKRWCTDNNITDFFWQRRFHDRIIRDNEEYARIKEYINTNIVNWDKDTENI